MLFLLSQAVDRAADRDPDHTAMRFAGRTATYGELAVASDRLAHALLDAGVRRGDRVGIHAGKGFVAGTAIYGIMKAGAAYVPLDPGAPRVRTAQVMEDAGIRTVVADPAHGDALAALAGETPLETAIGPADVPGLRTIDQLSVDTGPSTAPRAWPMEDDLSYVLYTSGSTGRPKGVAHTHRSALAYAEVSARLFDLTPADRLLNHAPLQFDLSTLDYFAAAVAGAATIIVPEPYTRVPASLSKLIADEAATVLFMVPFALRQLCQHGALGSRDLSAIRWVLFGGEPFPPRALRELMLALPSATFVNIYGPTEVNGVTCWTVPPIPEGSEAPIPIGRTYPNVDALVVDEAGDPVVQGETGELLIRSPTRMRGYWGRPDLDARAFERRTVGRDMEDTFVRTGDLVREREPGLFEFLGRADRQIKTRGYRVELDEVEAALLAHPGVLEAAVYAVPDGEGSRTIEAVAVPGRDGPTVEALLDHLRGTLPPYAVPVHLELRDALPRTSTDKADRVALRNQALARIGRAVPEAAPAGSPSEAS